jgi:ERCC4-type nuclease
MPDLERADQVAKDAPSPDGTLPTLRGFSKLADFRPVIVVDSREQEPLTFTRLKAVRGSLYSGDYGVLGLENSFAVERKGIDDLGSGCLASNRTRFEHELHRLRGYAFKRLLIVGTRALIEIGRYHSRIAPTSVLATLAAFEVRYDLPVVFIETPEAAAIQIERWVFYYCREVMKLAHALTKSSKENSRILIACF